MKKIKWWLSLLVILPFITGTANAQELKRQTIGSYGGGSLDGGLYVNQTVGQPFFTSTFSDGRQLSVHPGFQQSETFRVEWIGDDEAHIDPIAMYVYPNPASQVLNLEVEEIIERVEIQVREVNGRIVWEEQFDDFQKQTIYCDDWSDGMYFITVSESEKRKTTIKLIINQ